MTAEQTKKPQASFGLDRVAQIKPSAPRSVPAELADRVGREMGFVSREGAVAPEALAAAPVEAVAPVARATKKVALRQPTDIIEQLNMRLYLTDINSFIEHARDMRLSYKDLFSDVWRYYQQNKLDKAAD